jgi:hypothetical protein
MSQAPFEQAGSLRIGAVDFVSPDEIKVALDIEAPDSVAICWCRSTTDSSSVRQSGSQSSARLFQSGAGCKTSAL